MIIFGMIKLSGAIAILHKKKVLNLYEMPVMSEGKKNRETIK